jgi:hypothetical protein
MAQLIYGTNQQIRFSTDAEFYETLGFLAKNDGTTDLHWEHNEASGAWGSEGRIHCYQNIANFPIALSRAFTAGTGNVLHRINCNEFVACILRIHNFTDGRGQVLDVARILTTIPANHLVDFNRGLGL